MSSLWTTPERNSFTKVLNVVLRKEDQSPVSWFLSQSWRKCQTASTNLLGSFTQSIQVSTSYMDATLNQLNAASKWTYTLAKELTIRLEPRFTSLAQHTATKLKETIVPSMLTSLWKCSSYAIDFTQDAINKTLDFSSSVVKPYTIELAHGMVTVTKSLVHACPGMLTQAWEIASLTTTYLWGCWTVLASEVK